jgi:hypothetical protein
MVMLLIVSVLTGCSVATNTPTSAPSHRLTQRWTGQLGANRRSGGERVVRASAPRVLSVRGAFRSFLITGTDTSIRIGGS